MPRSSLDHIGRKEVREFSNRQHVESQHGEDLFDWLANKVSKQPKASVIHQNVHHDALLIESSLQLSAGARNGEIYSFDDDIHAMPLPKLLRQFLHWLGAARSQYQVCFALSQQRCKLDSESTRRAGYQRPFAIHFVHTASEFHAPLDLLSAKRHPLTHVAEEMIESVRLGHAL